MGDAFETYISVRDYLGALEFMVLRYDLFDPWRGYRDRGDDANPVITEFAGLVQANQFTLCRRISGVGCNPHTRLLRAWLQRP